MIILMRSILEAAKIPLITIVFFFLILFLYTKLAGPIPFFINSIQTTKSDLFRVEGQGKAAAAPDTASVSIGITKEANSVSAAQEQTNQVMSRIVEQLKSLDIPEKNIKTTNFNASPNYSFAGERQTVIGYTVTQNIVVKVQPIDKANQVVDMATKEGANIIGGISFTLSDEVRQQAQETARKEAIEKAKEKAESLARATGISLGRIIDVQEYPTYPDMDKRVEPFIAQEGLGGTVSTPTDVQPGESTVNLTVSLVYETR